MATSDGNERDNRCRVPGRGAAMKGYTHGKRRKLLHTGRETVQLCWRACWIQADRR